MAPAVSPGRRRPPVVRAAAFAAGLLGGACVTEYEAAPLVDTSLVRPDFAIAQSIPFGAVATSAEDQVLLDLYASVFQRLQQAVEEDSPATIDALVAAYDRGALPDWVRERFEGYRNLAEGQRFLRHARERSAVTLPAGDPPVLADGTALEFTFELPPYAEPVVLGGRDDADPTVFAVALTVEDAFVDGSSRRYSHQDFVRLPSGQVLAGEAALRLPIRVDLPANGAVMRTANVRVDLLPGYLLVGERRAAVRLATLAAASATQYPAERAEVLADPLAALRQNLKQGGVAGARRAWLAALATRGADRRAAEELLIEQVRTASAEPAAQAMAALQVLTGVRILVGDRDGWLAWWQSRQ
jgi:hypothetical protein